MRTDGRFGGSPVLGNFLTCGICLWGILEAGYGFMQVLGWRSSHHALFALTGHFQNPGPFGGFIACVMAVAGAWVMGFADQGRRITRYSGRMVGDSSLSFRMTTVMNGVAWAALGMGLLVLPASMSRAGWLGLAVALGVEALRQVRTREWLKRHSWAIPVGCAIILAMLAGAFLLKPDSALGRVHVWRMECRAIAQRPWTGSGPGMGPWAYGEAQEAFFREHLETTAPAMIRVAGCPDHAYNEYLGIGVEYGLPVMVFFVLLVVSSIVVLHKAGCSLAAGLTAWAVFAFASYPLSVPQLRILGAVFIVSAVISGLLMTPKKGTAWILAVLVLVAIGWIGFAERGRRIMGRGDRETEEVREVYAEGYALHQAGRYEESTKVLERGALMSSDPMFEIIMGKNAEALGDIDKAASLYEKAHYMVPSRLYPLVRLMRLRVRQGRDGDALATAWQIVAMPVNDRNAGMVRLHEETQKTLDSLIVVTGR